MIDPLPPGSADRRSMRASAEAERATAGSQVAWAEHAVEAAGTITELPLIVY